MRYKRARENEIYQFSYYYACLFLAIGIVQSAIKALECSKPSSRYPLKKITSLAPRQTNKWKPRSLALRYNMTSADIISENAKCMIQRKWSSLEYIFSTVLLYISFFLTLSPTKLIPKFQALSFTKNLLVISLSSAVRCD